MERDNAIAIELLAAQISDNRREIVTLRNHVAKNYLDKKEINKEFLSMETQRKIVTEAKQAVINIWVVAGIAVGGICTVGTFVLQLVEKIH